MIDEAGSSRSQSVLVAVGGGALAWGGGVWLLSAVTDAASTHLTPTCGSFGVWMDRLCVRRPVYNGLAHSRGRHLPDIGTLFVCTQRILARGNNKVKFYSPFSVALEPSHKTDIGCVKCLLWPPLIGRIAFLTLFEVSQHFHSLWRHSCRVKEMIESSHEKIWNLFLKI